MSKQASFIPDECSVRQLTGKVRRQDGSLSAEDSFTSWTLTPDAIEAHRRDPDFAAAFDASPDAAAIAAADQAAREKKQKK